MQLPHEADFIYLIMYGVFRWFIGDVIWKRNIDKNIWYWDMRIVKSSTTWNEHSFNILVVNNINYEPLE